MKVMTTEQVRNVHGGGAISSLGSLAVDAAPVVTALGQFLPSLGNYLQNPKTFNNTGSNRRRGRRPRAKCCETEGKESIAAVEIKRIRNALFSVRAIIRRQECRIIPVIKLTAIEIAIG